MPLQPFSQAITQQQVAAYIGEKCSGEIVAHSAAAAILAWLSEARTV